LEIPPTIGKFKDLVAIVLENCVKSVPEELGQLESLMFLTLQNNKLLESLPESLADLENLELITLSNSNPSIRIPERLKAIMVDEGDGFYAIER
jgi:Leucine-rich repeat (LRR) protein